MYAIEILLFLGLIICGLVFLVSQWLKRVPVAYAWDPNSHDKMATYSLDLLKTSEKKTLLGWLLWQARYAKGSPEQYIQEQIRRGSIEEDMNSYIIINSSYLGLDGTNGSYHFYNPNNGEGLSDSDKLTSAAAFVTHCDDIMPSALQRATSLDESLDRGVYRSTSDETFLGYLSNASDQYHINTDNMSWHFDIELRNYTIVDAMRYFVRGYHHLGFYAIGRIVHLLQDMAVPAHVRNDSHSGKVGDPKDPLEQFADEADGNKKDWTFSARRVYSSEGKRVFSAAQALWEAERHQHYKQTAGLFKTLSQRTYDDFYSVNTIPGNYDSHDPKNPTQKPFTGHKDLTKCHPAVFHLARLFNLFGNNIEANISQLLPQCFSNRRRDVIVDHVKTLIECKTGDNRCIINEDCNDFSISDKRRTCEKCVIDVQNISNSIKEVVNEMKSILSNYEGYTSGRIPSGALDYRMVESFRLQGNLVLQVCQNVLSEYERFNLESFVNEAMGSRDSIAVLQHWIESFSSPAVLSDLLKNLETSGTLYTYTIKPNAPYCLNYEEIHKQWLETQPRAVVFGAYLLANWFEWQYDPTRNASSPLGVGLWLNENAKEGEDPILRSVQKIEGNNSTTVKAKDTVTLGVANHLPCRMDMAVEIELMDEDEFLRENGVEIALSWGHLSPDWSQLDDGEYIIATGSEPPKKKIWLADTVKKEMGGRVGESIEKIVLSGSGGEKKVNFILEQTEPYNLSLIENFSVPQQAGGSGGISRVEENAGILKYTLNPTPGEPQGRDETNMSLLRMEFSTPVPAEQGA